MSSSVQFFPLAKPVLGREEEKAVIEALRSGWITLGPKTAEFEEQFCKYIGCKYAIALNSATAALHIAFFDLNLKPGDEVIVPAFTFAATVNTVIHSGGTPVLADVDPETFCLNPKSVEAKITSRTRAICAVHYAGHPCDMDALEKLAKKHHLEIVEDAATAVGTEYHGKKIGNSNHSVCFSFHPIKNMTTGDGGMLTINDKEKADRMRLLRLQGMNKEAWKRLDKSGSWFYEIVAPGFKYNMTDISAAIGIEQLKKLDKFDKRRTAIVKMYKKLLKNKELTFQKIQRDVVHSHNLFPILLPERLISKRNEIIDKLKEAQIGANVYYIPLNYHPYYQEKFGWKKGEYPVTESIYSRLINLPLYPSLKNQDIEYIAEHVAKLL
ncbi:MAG: DegT/DnrJ/EryC1/StrS family aminotransferase [Patescibacteria group bacterium]